MNTTHDTPNGHDVTDDAHRAQCAECTALWAELDQISAQAAHLPLLQPSRDLWQGIETRIGATGGLIGRTSGSAGGSPSGAAGASGSSSANSFAPVGDADSPRGLNPFVSRQTVRFAIAASLLVAVSSGVTWRLATRGGLSTEAAVPADLASGVDRATAEELHLASFQSSVQSMDDEIEALEVIVADRRSTLDPRTISILEENLQVIDRAISESRAALVADPASRFLSEQFTRAYSSKLTLLRDAATLPSGI